VKPVEIAEVWQTLQWKQRVKLAKAISGTVEDLTADAADQVIDLEVRRRRQEETYGEPPLTRREIEADLAGAGHTFDPLLPLAELRAIRDAVCTPAEA